MHSGGSECMVVDALIRARWIALRLPVSHAGKALDGGADPVPAAGGAWLLFSLLGPYGWGGRLADWIQIAHEYASLPSA